MLGEGREGVKKGFGGVILDSHGVRLGKKGVLRG